jgi:hypothetical protein
MKITSLALATTLLAGGAMAQTTSPPTSPTTGPTASPVRPGNTAPSGATSNTGGTPGIVDRNTGAAAAAGDRNQAVATTSATAPQPARGANSFSQAEARRRIERTGFQQVNGLHKDSNGVWRGTATHNGAQMPVWLDYKGNVSPASAGGAADNSGTDRNLDGTTGNPPGTAATRAMDRTLGTNTTGANPNQRSVDGTTGNQPGTAATRALDRNAGTNTSGANPTGATRP